MKHTRSVHCRWPPSSCRCKSAVWFLSIKHYGPEYSLIYTVLTLLRLHRTKQCHLQDGSLEDREIQSLSKQPGVCHLGRYSLLPMEYLGQCRGRPGRGSASFLPFLGSVCSQRHMIDSVLARHTSPQAFGLRLRLLWDFSSPQACLQSLSNYSASSVNIEQSIGKIEKWVLFRQAAKMTVLEFFRPTVVQHHIK